MSNVGNLSVELGISDDQLRAGLAQAVVQAQQAGQKMQAAMNAATNPRFGGRGMGGFAQAFSRMADDAQYGFRGIVNNFEQIGVSAGQAFGMTTEKAMALGAILTLLAVAINNATKELDNFVDGRSDFDKLNTAASAFAGELSRVDAQLKQLAEDTNALLKYDATSGIGGFLRRQIEEIRKLQPELGDIATFFSDSIARMTNIQEVQPGGVFGGIGGMADISAASFNMLSGLADSFSGLLDKINKRALDFVNETDRMFRKEGGMELDLPKMFPWLNGRLSEMSGEFTGTKLPWMEGRMGEMAGDVSGMSDAAANYVKEIEKYIADSFAMVRTPDVSEAIRGFMATFGDVIASEFAPATNYLEGRAAELAGDAKRLVKTAISPLTWFMEYWGQSVEDQIELNKNAGRQALRNKIDMIDKSFPQQMDSEGFRTGSELLFKDNHQTQKDMGTVFSDAIKGNAANIYGDLQRQLMKEGVQGNDAEEKSRILIGNAAKGVVAAFEDLSKRLPELKLDDKLKGLNNFKDTEENMQRLAATFRDRQKLMERQEGVQDRMNSIMSQRARAEVIGNASGVFERNINAGGEDPQVKAIEKLGEELKDILNEIKGLG